jgi:hypothetical protein
MKKVVGLGACVLDTLISCDTYPTEDKKQKAESILLAGGGPVGNALVVISKLGVQAEVIGGFGSDNAGEYILGDFQKYGVGVENATVLQGATSFTSYIVLAKDNASRTCVFDRGTVTDDPKNVQLSAIDGADVLHLDGNYLECAITAAKYAKQKGVKVSLDAGGLYAGTKFPQSVATDINSSENPVDIYKLKRGESASRNILRLIEIGDASINTAARNGRIKKVHYVDTQVSKVYIPILFLPIYAKEIKTIVYGE